MMLATVVCLKARTIFMISNSKSFKLLAGLMAIGFMTRANGLSLCLLCYRKRAGNLQFSNYSVVIYFL